MLKEGASKFKKCKAGKLTKSTPIVDICVSVKSSSENRSYEIVRRKSLHQLIKYQNIRKKRFRFALHLRAGKISRLQSLR